ncbi:MAG: hypothetical protein WKF47_11465 [Geodermatophilaceae bacterium]
MTALVGDHVLSGLLQGDLTEPGAQAMAQQRFLAELVVTAAEGSAQPRHLLLTPARDFDPATAGVLMAAAATTAVAGHRAGRGSGCGRVPAGGSDGPVSGTGVQDHPGVAAGTG